MNPERVKRWISSPPRAALAIGFIAFLLVALLEGNKPFYYDSGTYWSLSHSFTRSGHFSLLDFYNNGLRGYVLPLLYFLAQKLTSPFGAGDSLIVNWFNAATFALIGAVLLPCLARITWPEQGWGIGRRLALCAVLLVFWRGFLSFPLSDFPALAAALLALIAVSSYDSRGWMAVAGASAAIAMNIRPSYTILVAVLLTLVAWGWFDRSRRERLRWQRVAIGPALFLLAFAVVALPQSISNHEHIGTYSPVPGGSELVDLQYTEGLRMQRYDTYVGGTDAEARMTYLDPSTEDIVLGLDEGVIHGTGEYARILLEHPLTMAGVFLRHVVNGLDQRYTTPYIERRDGGGSKPLRAAGFLIVFLALLRICWPTARRRLEPARWRYPLALLVGSSTAIASAVETRFMLPVFLLAATVVLCPAPWVSPLRPATAGWRRYLAPAAIALAFAAFVVLCWVICSGASDNLRYT